jgi:acyl-CoA thioester hydrolase
MGYAFTLGFKVRDYECDLQGVVNNSVYQNYLEHTRHEYLLSRGLSFAELTRRGIHLVVVRAELDYKLSLKSGDEFWIGLNTEKLSKVRGLFTQDIFRQHDDRLALSARVEWTALNPKGRPFYSAELDTVFNEDLE